MLRKQWSYGQARRSSAPKRLSVTVPDGEDKNKNVGDGKKSFIPRYTTVSSRSSSVEREGFPSSSRNAQKFPRSTSAESIADENPRSEYRSRNTENAFTPKHSMKTHGCKSTVSVQRTVRKDTRPLSDRAFQMTELAKVEEYLVAKEIITPGQSLCNSMTLKLFVQIMNSLFKELFPEKLLTLSNYSETIPSLMRKLKYPGNITRSSLVTANSSHSWPNILGLLSWLVDVINTLLPNVKYIISENDGETEDVLDCEKVKKLFDYTNQRYIEWNFNGMPFTTEADDEFFDDLVSNSKPLWDKINEIKKDIQDLENLLRETESTEDEQKFKIVKADLEKKKAEVNGHKEKLKNMQIALEKSRSKMQSMLIENNNLKICISNCDALSPGSSSCNADDIVKFQCDAVSRRNVIKLRDGQLTDINNRCYSLDLANARIQGKLDKERLQHEATLRECISEYISAEELELSLNYGNEDNSRILAEFYACVKKIKVSLDNLSKEYNGKENSNKELRNEIEEKIKLCETDIFNRQSELQLDLKIAEFERKSSDLRSYITNTKEEFCKLKEKQTSLKHQWELLSNRKIDLEEESKDLDEKFFEEDAKCLRILKTMYMELHNHISRCREAALKTLSD